MVVEAGGGGGGGGGVCDEVITCKIRAGEKMERKKEKRKKEKKSRKPVCCEDLALTETQLSTKLLLVMHDRKTGEQRGERTGVERGSAQRSSFKGRERAIVSQAITRAGQQESRRRRGKRKRSAIFLQRTREGHRQSGHH